MASSLPSSSLSSPTCSPVHRNTVVGGWKPPWKACSGVPPTPVVVIRSMCHHDYNAQIQWKCWTDGCSGSVGIWKPGSIHGGPSGGASIAPGRVSFNSLLCSSSPCAQSDHAAIIPRSASSPSYSPNLAWISRVCGKSADCGCWGGTVSGDRRSFVQILKSKPAPIAMVPPRPGHGWGREGFNAGRRGRGDG
jgi:hypothetical protein